jgi:hypothetical protein
MLAVAIEINGDVLGTLALYDKKALDMSASRLFSEQDREILLNFGLQVSKGLKRFFPFPTAAPVSDEPVLADL